MMGKPQVENFSKFYIFQVFSLNLVYITNLSQVTHFFFLNTFDDKGVFERVEIFSPCT